MTATSETIMRPRDTTLGDSIPEDPGVRTRSAGIVLIPATYPCASGFTSRRNRQASFLCAARETPEHFSHELPVGPQITSCRAVTYV